MGCVSSVLIDEKAPEEQTQETVKGDAKSSAVTVSASGKPSGSATETPKSKTTRARRLSYVNYDDAPTAQVLHEDQAQAQGSPAGKSSKTRVRRLSYVSGDSDGAQAGEQPGLPDLDDAQDSASQGPPTVTGQRTGRIGVQVACMSRAGREPSFKKTNQDNFFAFEKYVTGDQSLFGAFDGHGPNGHLVSSYIKHHLPLLLVSQLNSQDDINKALWNVFLEVDQSLQASGVDCEFSGTTAVVAFLKDSKFHIAWVGDSRAVLARKPGDGPAEAVDLTVDHKPTLPEENKRILKNNGRVERLADENGGPIGPYRVWLQYAWYDPAGYWLHGVVACVIPGLAMSRALGDVLAHQVGVTSEPETDSRTLEPEDNFVIMASDGVWEFVGSQEAVDIVAQYESVEEGCRQLVDEAYQRWLSEEEGIVDDITAVVVKFVH